MTASMRDAPEGAPVGLEGKVIVVTGGGSGMGRDACLALARTGAHVVLGNRNRNDGEAVVRAIAVAGGSARFLPTDVSRPDDCRALVACALDHFGRLDGAFNNAGLQREFADIHETPDEDISDVIDINLKGMLYMMKYEAAAMLANGGGSIVNNSSIFGLKAMPRLAYYVAAKHGIVGATRAAALDYADRGIRVNAVCPGPIKTPSYDRVTGSDDAMYADAVPMRRIGGAAEVSAAVLWLLSEQSSYVTGAALPVDGGMAAA
jgi:NAD(P)-dependent dehydrogenase (short-subunit alcohol dehydrogenase family)